MVTGEELLDAQDILQEMRLARGECPLCGEPMEHFSGLEEVPEHLYCPCCMDYGYIDNQRVIQYE